MTEESKLPSEEQLDEWAGRCHDDCRCGETGDEGCRHRDLYDFLRSELLRQAMRTQGAVEWMDKNWARVHVAPDRDDVGRSLWTATHYALRKDNLTTGTGATLPEAVESLRAKLEAK